MNELSGGGAEITRNAVELSRAAHAAVLQRLAVVGQVRVAEALGVHESTVSRCVNSDLERCVGVITAAGLKIVPFEVQCYSPRKVAVLMELARDHLNLLRSPDQLLTE